MVPTDFNLNEFFYGYYLKKYDLSNLNNDIDKLKNSGEYNNIMRLIKEIDSINK